MFRYVPNLRSFDLKVLENLMEFQSPSPPPDGLTKSDFRNWCAKTDVDHCFYTLNEAVVPARRIGVDNPINRSYGLVVDYDSPKPIDIADKLRENRRTVAYPTYAHTTQSGNFRLIWMFDAAVPLDESYARQFFVELSDALRCEMLFAGYDACSEAANQLYEIGSDWQRIGDALDPSIVTGALFKATARKPVKGEVDIPMEVVEQELISRYGDRLQSCKVGDRVPLFWINDGVDRIGGQVTEHGIVCYSERAGAGFVGWPELLGHDFVKRFETRKVSNAVTDVWYDGKRYYRYTPRGLFDLPKEDLTLELRAAGLANEKRKGQRVSEVENALLFIQTNNRVHGVAPVLHEKAKVVEVNGSVVLNSSRIKPVEPAKEATADEFPFLSNFFSTFLDDPDESHPTDFLFAWMKRAYEAMHYGKLLQGQAVILVGPTGRGKSLFSNYILAKLLGGVATASDFLQARTAFNKELAENPVWSVDDTASATNAADHRKFTELLKARIANPFIEVQEKYMNSMRIPHCGRVVISLNEDVQSLAVVPALDVSNADKILGFRISPDHRPEFPDNRTLETTIDNELPFFAKWLLDWSPPEHTAGSARYGVAHYVHPFILNAARDNGSRAPALEAIEMFARVHRDATGNTKWKGTATELRSLFCDYPDLSGLAFGRDHYALSRGLASAEEAYQTGASNARPITSESRGKGKRFTIDLSEKYDDTE
jgi:hypothetical protein